VEQRQLFVAALATTVVLGAAAVVLLSRQNEAAGGAETTRTVSYRAGGQTMNASLTRISGDVLEGARFVRGSASAPVTVVEFADYQCPACATFATEVEPAFLTTLVESGKVRYAYRDFPLPNHANAVPSARAAACANEHGKFEAMHAFLYRAQERWSTLPLEAAQNFFGDAASQLGLDEGAFNTCQRSTRFDAAIESDRQAGQRAGLEGTPSFVVAGYRVTGALPLEGLEAVIEAVTSR
jgi:protein-disulfide isomerase